VRSDRFVIALTLIAAACAEGPTAPESSLDAPSFAVVESTNAQITLLSTAFFVPCANGGAGEWVLVDGTLHLSDRLMIDSEGQLTLVTHVNPHNVKGQGLDTGNTYIGTGATRTEVPVTGAGTVRVTNNFLLISQGEGPNLRVHERRVLLINELGEISTISESVSIKCR
jgi:hypothetical protein